MAQQFIIGLVLTIRTDIYDELSNKLHYNTDLEVCKIRHNKLWNHLFHKNIFSFTCIITRSLWQMCYTEQRTHTVLKMFLQKCVGQGCTGSRILLSGRILIKTGSQSLQPDPDPNLDYCRQQEKNCSFCTTTGKAGMTVYPIL